MSSSTPSACISPAPSHSTRNLSPRALSLSAAVIPLVLIVTFLQPAGASGQADDGTSSGEPLSGDYAGRAASRLIAFTEEALAKGAFRAATDALDRAQALVPDAPELVRLRTELTRRKLGLPRAAEPLDLTGEIESLYTFKAKSRSVPGWKASRGKWASLPKAIACQSEEGEAQLYRSGSTLPGRFVLTARITPPAGGKAGLVLGATRKGKVGVALDGSGARVAYMKSLDCIGDPFPLQIKPGKPNRTEVIVRDETLILKVNGRAAPPVIVEGFSPGKVGLFAEGPASFADPAVCPLEEDLLIDRARKALRSRKYEPAATFLLRAEAIAPENPEISLRLGETLDRLGFADPAAMRLTRVKTLIPEDAPRNLKRLRTDAEKALAETAAIREGFETLAKKLTDELAGAAETALAEGRREAAREAVALLEKLGTHRHLADALGSRLFLAERGAGPEGLVLREAGAKELDGWTAVSGRWTVDEEGHLAAHAEFNAPALLRADPLPAFDRFYLHTRQCGTGAYINQGLRIVLPDGVCDLSLYKAMVGSSRAVGRKITLERDGATVYYRGMRDQGLMSNAWYDVDLLVDGNLVTVLFDGNALFTKVMPRPVKPEVVLFVTMGQRGRFGKVTFRPLGDERVYRALLAEKGLFPRSVIECEIAAAEGKGRDREIPFAYGGHALAGAPTRTEPVGFDFSTLRLEDATLSLRYAAPRGDRYAAKGASTRLAAILDGRTLPEALTLDAAAGLQDFAYARLPLGPLASGRHRIELRHLEGGGGLTLDRIEVTAPGDMPRGENKIHASDRAEHFRIRLSPGIELPRDADEIFGLLEVLRDYMVDYYGFEPVDPLYFNLIARACWGDPHKGGYATGDNIFMPDDTSYSDVAVIMHEMSHCFDRGQGFNPPWFGEGKSFPCYDRFVDETGAAYRKYRSAFSLSAKDTGARALKALEKDGVNLFPYWGTQRFPYWSGTPENRILTPQAYKAANWFCYELSKRLGPTWLEDYFRLVRRDLEKDSFFMPADRDLANGIIADYFARSSGKGEAVRVFFREQGFTVHDPGAYERLVLTCDGTDGDHLVRHEGDRIEALPEGAGKGRRVTGEGFLMYVAPVPPDAKAIEVTVAKMGRGAVEVDGNGKTDRLGTSKREERRLIVEDPVLLGDARLVLKLTPDPKDEEGLLIERIILRPVR